MAERGRRRERGGGRRLRWARAEGAAVGCRGPRVAVTARVRGSTKRGGAVLVRQSLWGPVVLVAGLG